VPATHSAKFWLGPGRKRDSKVEISKVKPVTLMRLKLRSLGLLHYIDGKAGPRQGRICSTVNRDISEV
jgi:hypothetical protein